MGKDRRISADVNWTRAFAIFAALTGLLVGMMSLLDHGIHRWGWRPPIVAMISLTISSLVLAFCAFIRVFGNRRKRSQHA